MNEAKEETAPFLSLSPSVSIWPPSQRFSGWSPFGRHPSHAVSPYARFSRWWPVPGTLNNRAIGPGAEFSPPLSLTLAPCEALTASFQVFLSHLISSVKPAPPSYQQLSLGFKSFMCFSSSGFGVWLFLIRKPFTQTSASSIRTAQPSHPLPPCHQTVLDPCGALSKDSTCISYRAMAPSTC